MFSRDEMRRAIEDALKSMEGIALELYRRGREEAREELEEARARNADMRAMLEQVTSERDEARASCTDCAMYAERSARFAEQADRLQSERDEARAELSKLRKDYDSVLEANVSLLDGAPYVTARAAFRRGAEAMREACADMVRSEMTTGLLTPANVAQVVKMLATMPIPGES